MSASPRPTTVTPADASPASRRRGTSCASLAAIRRGRRQHRARHALTVSGRGRRLSPTTIGAHRHRPPGRRRDRDRRDPGRRRRRWRARARLHHLHRGRGPGADRHRPQGLCRRHRRQCHFAGLHGDPGGRSVIGYDQDDDAGTGDRDRQPAGRLRLQRGDVRDDGALSDGNVLDELGEARPGRPFIGFDGPLRGRHLHAVAEPGRGKPVDRDARPRDRAGRGGPGHAVHRQRRPGRGSRGRGAVLRPDRDRRLHRIDGGVLRRLP